MSPHSVHYCHSRVRGERRGLHLHAPCVACTLHHSFTLPAPHGDEFVRSPAFLNPFTPCPRGATAILSFSITPIPSQSSWGRGCLNPRPPERMSPSQSRKESLSIGVDAPPPGVSPPPSVTSLNSQLPTRKVLSPARQSRHTDEPLPQAPGW